MSDNPQALEERIEGDWQQPVNRWQGAPGSIHTDSVAKSVGMRGGTIPGTVHLTHFPALLTDLFGERWLESGSISMFYTYATTDGEDVRAVVSPPPVGETDNVQLKALVETPDGRIVTQGTVAVGKPDAVPYIRSLPLKDAPEDEIRILSAMKSGSDIPGRDDYIIKGEPDQEIRDPQLMYRALAVFPKDVDTSPAVGFFGATEVILHAGPIRTGVPYRKSGKVACVGASSKTEFAWFDSWLHDQDGQLIAEMRHMTRWMKVSSPLWKDD